MRSLWVGKPAFRFLKNKNQFLQITNQINIPKQGGSYAVQTDGLIYRACSVSFAEFGSIKEGIEAYFQKQLFLQDNPQDRVSAYIVEKGLSNNETDLPYFFASDHNFPSRQRRGIASYPGSGSDYWRLGTRGLTGLFQRHDIKPNISQSSSTLCNSSRQPSNESAFAQTP